MKGIIDIEFTLAVLVFLIAITFVTVSIISTIPQLTQESGRDDLKSRVWQISELMLMDEGNPAFWTSGNVNRIGLSNGTKYIISSGKISELQTLCASYSNFKELLNVSFKNDVVLNVTEIGGSSALCSPQLVSQVAPRFTITRLAYSTNNKNVTLEVSVL